MACGRVVVVVGLLGLAAGQLQDRCSADAMSRCTDPLRVVTDNKEQSSNIDK